MDFPQYFHSFHFVRWRTICQTQLYTNVLHPKSYSHQAVLWCLLVLVKGEHLWIVWHRHLTWEARSLYRTRGIWCFLLPLLVEYIGFAAFGSGRRRTAACLVSYNFFAGHDETGCALGQYSHIRDSNLSYFASSYCLTIRKLWFWLWGAALALGLCLNCSGAVGVTAVGLGHIVAFFRNLSPCAVVTTLY